MLIWLIKNADKIASTVSQENLDAAWKTDKNSIEVLKEIYISPLKNSKLLMS